MSSLSFHTKLYKGSDPPEMQPDKGVYIGGLLMQAGMIDPKTRLLVDLPPDSNGYSKVIGSWLINIWFSLDFLFFKRQSLVVI
mmetsp:Transcript_44625/g.73734  ORF Transcript_44625/g.73734 Transcript_44625/m.73734 type:complete len:83 (+) Transcript_44625:113-361(+)